MEQTPSPGQRLTPPTPLDYRLPGTPGPGGDVIFRWLCTQHGLGIAGAMLGIVVGLSVLILSAWVVSGAVAMIVSQLGGAEHAVAVGWTVFVGYLSIIAPLLLWRTAVTGGEFYADQVIGSDAFHGKPVNMSDWTYRGDIATVSLYGDLLFWGPRLIVDGSRRLAGRDIVRSRDVLRRASFVLAHLIRADDTREHGSVRTKALRLPNEDVIAFQGVMHWLDRHDYVGISADGQRLWLRSNVRQTLALMLNISPRPLRAKRTRGPSSGTKSAFAVERVAV